MGDTNTSSQFALANAVNLNNSVIGLGQSSRITLLGPITLTGINTISNTGTPTSNSVVLAGTISDGASAGQLNITGGSLIFTNNQNNYSGGTLLAGGTVQLAVGSSGTAAGSTGPLGTGTVTLLSGNLSAGRTGGNLQDVVSPNTTLVNPITLVNGGISMLTTAFDGGTGGSGATGFSQQGIGNNGDTIVTLAGAVSISGSNSISFPSWAQLTISGQISGPGNLFENNSSGAVGLGVLYLTGNNTAWTGGMILNGTNTGGSANEQTTELMVGNSNALGIGVFTMAGGTLTDDGKGSYVIANRFQMDSGQGKLIYVSTVANTLTFTGVWTSNGGYTKIGPGNLIIQNSDARTSTTAIAGGTLTLQAGGQLLLTSSLTINEGGTLVVDNTVSNNADRIGDGIPVHMAGGTLTYLGSNVAQTASSETMGSLFVDAGGSTINSQVGSGAGDTVNISVGTMTRTSGGFLNFTGVGTALSSGFANPNAANQINITGTASGTGTIPNGIVNNDVVTVASNGVVTTSAALGPVKVTNGFFLPYVTVAFAATLGSAPTAMDFAGVTGPSITNNPPAGPYSIAAFGGEVNETLAAAGTNDVVNITGSDSTLGGPKTVAGLLISGTGGTIASGSLLTIGTFAASNNGSPVGGGAGILTTGSNNTFNVPISFVGNEGYLLTGAGASLNMTSAISNGTLLAGQTNPLTIGGLGTLTLSGNNTYQTPQPVPGARSSARSSTAAR